MKRFNFTLLLLCFLYCHSFSQSLVTTLPRASQPASISQGIGLSEISIDYHRPAVKERSIWGQLVPYDAVWRAGANENTLITFSHAVKIEGQDLAAGTYGLHLIPGKSNSTFIFSKATSSWGSFSYTPTEDALRVSIKSTAAPQFYELLTFTFEKITPTTTTCALNWADQRFPMRIEFAVHDIVISNIREELRTRPSFTWLGWNEAANYCLVNEVNLAEGLSWANRSVFMNPNPTNMLVKANLTGKIQGNGDADKEKEISIASLENDLTSYAVTWKEWHAAAQFCQQAGAAKKGLEWVKKSVEMSPNMTNQMTQSDMYLAVDNTKEAERVKKAAIARGSNAELNAYGYQLLFGGSPAKAVEVFEINAQKNPEDPNVWDSLGEGYVGNQQPEKAIESLKKSLSLNPIPAVRANSIRLLKQLGVEYEGTKP